MSITPSTLRRLRTYDDLKEVLRPAYAEAATTPRAGGDRRTCSGSWAPRSLDEDAGETWIGVSVVIDQLDAGRRRDLDTRGLIRPAEL